MKLERFHSFNESKNPDVSKLEPNTEYVLEPDDEDSVTFIFYGSAEYLLKIYDSKEVCRLDVPGQKPIWMTYDGISKNKERILSLEPTPKEGEALYMWITRIVAVVEWSNSGMVDQWHVFEAGKEKRFGRFQNYPNESSRIYPQSSLVYNINTPVGIFSLQILDDYNTFKLTIPNVDEPVTDRLSNLCSTEEYYKALVPGDVIYNWIIMCFNKANISIPGE